MKEEQQQSTVTVLLAIGLGFMIGQNWPQIQKNIAPLLKTFEKQYGNLAYSALGAMAGQKENVEDFIAQWQEAQKKSSTEKGASAKKRRTAKTK